MRAIVLHHPGGPEALSYEEVPTPSTKPGWSLIKVRGFGINRSEIFTRNGWSPTVQLPRILGIEAVGTVVETTDEVNLPEGQTVISIMGEMGRAFDGGYAEYALLPNDQLYPVHTNLSWAELAAVPETYYTAYGSLMSLFLQPHDHLLIRGATSGVGTAAAKLARAIQNDVVITGTTRKPAKKERLLQTPIDDVVIERDGELETENQYNKILELVGPKTMQDSLAHLAGPGGVMCITGELGGEWSTKDFDPIASIPSGSYLTAFNSGKVTEFALNAMLHLIEEAHIDVHPTKVFDLEHTADAHAFLDSADSFGKVVVLPFGE